MRVNSAKLVTTSGLPRSGPVRVGPAMAATLVPTPSIDLERKLTSSTNTPGAKVFRHGLLLSDGSYRFQGKKLLPSDRRVKMSPGTTENPMVGEKLVLFSSPISSGLKVSGSAGTSLSVSSLPSTSRVAL